MFITVISESLIPFHSIQPAMHVYIYTDSTNDVALFYLGKKLPIKDL